MAVRPSFAELGIAALDTKFGGVVARDVTSTRDSFGLRVAPRRQTLVAFAPNTPTLGRWYYMLVLTNIFLHLTF